MHECKSRLALPVGIPTRTRTYALASPVPLYLQCACIVFTLVVPKVGKITMKDVEKYQVGHVRCEECGSAYHTQRGLNQHVRRCVAMDAIWEDPNDPRAGWDLAAEKPLRMRRGVPPYM